MQFLFFLISITPHVETRAGNDKGLSEDLTNRRIDPAVRWSKNSRKHLRISAPNHSIAVSSGTDALRFALMACGVKPGDVVVTVPHTFIATTEAISQAGALPEFVDIDERTYNMGSARSWRIISENQCDYVILFVD